MKAQLVTRNPDARTNKVTIYAEYRYQNRCKRVPTGIKVHEKHWDVDKKIIRANGTDNVGKDNIHLRQVLSGLEEQIKSLYVQNGNVPPTIDQLNASYQQQAAALGQHDGAPVPPVTVLEVLKDFIDEHVGWAKSTRANFRTLQTNIEAYQTAHKCTWVLDGLTNEDIIKWQHWLVKKYDYKNSTLGKRVRLLRQFLREKGAPGVQIGKIKSLYSQLLTPPVVLYLHEIEAVQDLQVTGKLERVRDLMVAQIFSGLRFSDLIRLRKNHIQKSHIVIMMQKTGLTVRVPIFRQLREIIEKYTFDGPGGELMLPKLTGQKFNVYIKELCQMVPALHEPVVIESKKRDRMETTQVPKWKLISSHSSRRSFCTLCLDMGYSVKQVMPWSGHRSFAAFSRYIGLTDIKEDAGADFDTRYKAKLAGVS